MSRYQAQWNPLLVAYQDAPTFVQGCSPCRQRLCKCMGVKTTQDGKCTLHHMVAVLCSCGIGARGNHHAICCPLYLLLSSSRLEAIPMLVPGRIAVDCRSGL